MDSESPDSAEPRQDRRQKKLRKKRQRMPKHGRGLAQVYRDVILKRLRGGRKRQK